MKRIPLCFLKGNSMLIGTNLKRKANKIRRNIRLYPVLSEL